MKNIKVRVGEGRGWGVFWDLPGIRTELADFCGIRGKSGRKSRDRTGIKQIRQAAAGGASDRYFHEIRTQVTQRSHRV